MSVELTKDTRPGDIYLNNANEIYILQSFYTKPSAIMRNVATGRETGGAIGCGNLREFDRVSDLDKKYTEDAIKTLVYEMKSLQQEKINLQQKIIELQQIINEEREKNHESNQT